jgi:hypothetical protein
MNYNTAEEINERVIRLCFNSVPSNTMLKVNELKLGGCATFQNEYIEINFDRDETASGKHIQTLQKLEAAGMNAKEKHYKGRSKYNKGIQYGRLKIFY